VTKGKAASPDAGAGGPGNFLSILGTLGDAPATDALPVSQATDVLVADPAAAVPMDTPPFDASLLLQQNPQIGAAQLVLKPATGDVPQEAPVSLAALQSPAMAVDAKPAVAGADLPATDKPLPVAMSRAGLPNAGAEKSQVKLQVPADESAESSTQVLQHAGVHSKTAKDALRSDSSFSAASGNTTGAVAERPDPKDTKLLAALEAAKTQEPARTVEPILVPLAVRQEKPQGERAAKAFQNAEPTYSGASLGVSAPDFSQAAAQAPAMAPEMQVAEQVTYWVSQNIQNAEMKLDGLGQSPVEVSISVQGNEAQIAFRSDEVLTRGVLENAGTHLKDMLQREGMVLTGVSVGTSGGGEAGNGERKSRQPARQVAIAPLKPATTESLRGPRLQSGRSVDLFV